VATQVVMPKWGLTMKEGKVSRWFKAEGDSVNQGEPLLEVETSKITNNVESPADGILFQIVVPAGETVAVQTVVAVIATPGETPQRIEAGATASASGKKATATAADGEKAFVPATPIARRLAREQGIDLTRVTGTGPGGRVTEADVRGYQEPETAGVDASAKALELAREAGIDLTLIQGSGPGGKITKVDVLRAMNPAAPTEPRTPASKAAVPVGQTAGPAAGSLVPMAGMRKIIADNMMASLHNSAQLSVFVEIDATKLVSLRDKVRARCAKDDQIKVSVNDIIALAVCRALKDHPVMNSWLTDQGIVLHPFVNLGVAVALDNGLMVPNIKDAQKKSLLELAAETRAMARKAREGGLTMDEIQGGTFTITNVSMLGVDGFTPILNPPETGILGVGRLVEKPAVHNGQMAIRTMMTLSLSFDHRVADGAPAMRFLRTLADYLEDPVMLLA
jgi:pyruvate dehydrogenase E2 component (dihydrolipoamide acetyltransferase)